MADFNPNKCHHPVGFCRLREWLSRLVNRIVNLLIIKYPFPDQGYWWLAGVFLIFIGGMGVLLSIGGQPGNG